MIFNRDYKLLQDLGPISQEDIHNTPEFFAMSAFDIVDHKSCPEHLRKILKAMPWEGRPNFVQVRPQDFRRGVPHVLGMGWHVDLNTALANGHEHVAKTLEEFRSMVVSFGEVVDTEFVKNPFEVDTTKIDPFNHVQFAGHVASLNPEVVKLAPNQLASYTSLDVHRVSPHYKIGNMRLIIVTVECDVNLPKEGGQVRPSIRQREA